MPGPQRPLRFQTLVYSTPMRVRFRGLDSRDGMIFSSELGLGEFSPFWDYGPQESGAWLRAAREACLGQWPTPVRDLIPVNVTVPAVGPEQAAEIVDASGCHTAKVKVAEPGQDLAAEVDRIVAVRQALGPAGEIRIDANGAWDTATALAHLTALNKAAGGLQYAEQPCASVAELAEVRRKGCVPVAADESIRRATDPYLVAKAEAADVMVLKVQPLGGVRECLRLAEEIGLPAVVSSALETSVGIAAGLSLAASLPELPFACGLATVQLMQQDVVTDPLLPVDGNIVFRKPRLTIHPEDWAAPPELEQRWRRRLGETEALL